MPQIQVRDEEGRPIPDINVRFCEGEIAAPQISDGFFDVRVDASGNQTWPIRWWPTDIPFTFHANAGADGNPKNPLYEEGVAHAPAGHIEDVVIVLARAGQQPTPSPPTDGPRGIVRTSGRMLLDDRGPRHFLSTTLMWSVFGYRSERDQWLEDVRWCQSHGMDGIRTLGSVVGPSWAGRQTDPTWPDYEDVLAGQIDTAFAHGLRQFPFTMLGDHYTDVHRATDRMLNVLRGREDKIGYVEIANEWGHAVEISQADLMTIALKVRQALPNTLLALSAPKVGQVDAMKALMKQIGGPLIFPRHTERKENDRNWRQVRQAYDFNSDPWTGSDQEPPGPASSVGELWKPRQLGAMRWLAHAAGCGVFVYHTGNGIRGNDDPSHNRQPRLAQIAGVEDQVAALHMAPRFLPEGVQNWKIENNGRDDKHPLQLPDAIDDGFWEGDKDVEPGDCNKNYAALGPDGRFLVGLFGLNEGDDRRAGQALYDLHVDCFDSLTGALVKSVDLARNQWLTLPGRRDRESSYYIVGQRR